MTKNALEILFPEHSRLAQRAKEEKKSLNVMFAIASNEWDARNRKRVIGTVTGSEEYERRSDIIERGFQRYYSATPQIPSSRKPV